MLPQATSVDFKLMRLNRPAHGASGLLRARRADWPGRVAAILS